MPYKQVWEPAPQNMNLAVHAELPEGAFEETGLLADVYKSARGYVNGEYTHYHHCRKCKGWIEGHPSAFPVSNLGFLSGRKGTEYFCRRCGNEIGFRGMMA